MVTGFTADFSQVYEISMSTVIKMECDDCSTGKYVEKETISHIREKVKTSYLGWASIWTDVRVYGDQKAENRETVEG